MSKPNRGHGSPYDRGGADSWYRRAPSPHYWPEGTGRGEKVTDLTPEQKVEYWRGWHENEAAGAHKEWD